MLTDLPRRTRFASPFTRSARSSSMRLLRFLHCVLISASTATTPSACTISGLTSASATAGSFCDASCDSATIARASASRSPAGLPRKPLQHREGLHLGDHRVRGRQIDRREAQRAVAIDLREDAAGRHHDERAGLAVDAIADQRLADARSHRRDQHAVRRDAGALPHGLAHLSGSRRAARRRREC